MVRRMLRRVLGPGLVTVAIASSASISAGSTVGSAQVARPCGRVGSAFALDITAQGVSCHEARRFVAAVTAHRIALKARNTSYDGYRCRPRQTGAAGWAIRCTRGPRVIRWLAGT
jgi:hypothetical protein